MGRPEGTPEARVTEEWEWYNLTDNMTAMSQQLWGEPLHNLRRKVTYDSQFLAVEHPVLHQALYELPAWSALYNFTKGEFPTHKQVDKIAVFCNKAFSFDRTITREDLLYTDLAPFPPLREENERWKRYVGIYRGFYLYPESLDGKELHGSLLQLQEYDGELFCRWVTGIRRDERFGELEKLFLEHPGPELFHAFQLYNASLPPYESRLVFYEGIMDSAIPGYFLLKLRRREHSNAALVLLRRWGNSAQSHYSGGAALVNLFRDQSKAAASSQPMLLARQSMTLAREKEVLLRHLGLALQQEPGLSISLDMDRRWNQALMEWSYRQEAQTGKEL